MTSGRPPEGQVLSFRARLAVAAYVLFTWPVMTAFFFGPLAVLVAASRPHGRRAWLWLAALALWLSLWAAQPGGLLEALIRAAAVLSTGIGVLFLLLSAGSVSTRALRGTAAVVLSTAGLSRLVGLRWADLERAVVQQGMLAQRAATELLSRGGSTPDPATLDALRTLGEGLRPMAPFFPGVLALILFAGLCLAALVAPRIGGRAVAPIPGPFDGFRFSDHLVWLVIVGLIGLLFAESTPLAGPAASMVTFGVGLYALRGSAVLTTALRSAPRLFIGMLFLGALFLLPFAVGGLALLGLADTWLDFRRRMAPPPSGGLDR
ncbi:MAG: DUF2232 domain-containing protein [Gemmatimonadales bacterium]|nr:MAG: DUF2232 domain-containing protein [Gemmatimonadales bacterium]